MAVSVRVNLSPADTGAPFGGPAAEGAGLFWYPSLMGAPSRGPETMERGAIEVHAWQIVVAASLRGTSPMEVPIEVCVPVATHVVVGMPQGLLIEGRMPVG